MVDVVVLCAIAEGSIRHALRTGRHDDPPLTDLRDLPANLDEPGASFVTLTRHHQLRGCIGSLSPHRPLALDVARNAQAAAFGDPRFNPLEPTAWPEIEIEVSVLLPLRPFPVTDRADLLTKLRPGVDGLLVTTPGHRATFLPSVWEQLGDPDRFVAALWHKAGLHPDAWPEGLRLERYETVTAVSPPPRRPL